MSIAAVMPCQCLLCFRAWRHWIPKGIRMNMQQTTTNNFGMAVFSLQILLKGQLNGLDDLMLLQCCDRLRVSLFPLLLYTLYKYIVDYWKWKMSVFIVLSQRVFVVFNSSLPEALFPMSDLLKSTCQPVNEHRPSARLWPFRSAQDDFIHT